MILRIHCYDVRSAELSFIPAAMVWCRLLLRDGNAMYIWRGGISCSDVMLVLQGLPVASAVRHREL